MLFLLSGLALPALRVDGAEAGAGGEENRRVLALYDSTEKGNTPDVTDLHHLLEMPLNRIGLTLEYHDVNRRPLPEVKQYRGVMTVFEDDQMEQPEDYCRWIESAYKSGVKVVQFGPLGATRDLVQRPVEVRPVDQIELLSGLRPGGVWRTVNPLAIAVEDTQPEHFRFETQGAPTPEDFAQVLAQKPDVQVWRTGRLADQPDSAGVAVAVSPRGGYVQGLFYMVRLASAPFHYTRWDLDLFAFLEAALDCKGGPRPDVTTYCGLRGAYSHIDGDGLGNLTQDLPGEPRPAGRVMLEQVLRRYPVPVTVGPVVSEIDPAVNASPYYGQWRDGQAVKLPPADEAAPTLTKGEAVLAQPVTVKPEELREIVRQILALPNVQAGCHGYAHPLDWEQHVVALRVPGYHFSYEEEIAKPVAILERDFLPPGKKVEVFLWTGNCRPELEGLNLVNKLGLAALNGGDGRWDSYCNSISLIPPLTRPVPPLRQVYASAANEETFTEMWTENFGGYRNILETFRRTEAPRRLTPVDIYYHFFSAERLAGLRALQTVYDWAVGQPLCWIHAAEHARAVEGFHRARWGKTGAGAFWIADFAPCPTVRFDDCALAVDLERSKGVWGFNHYGGSLYVSLAPVARAEIVLTKDPPQRPCLLTSTGLLRGVVSDAVHWKAEVRRYAPGGVTLQGCGPGSAWQVRTGNETQRLTADGQGQLRIALPKGLGEWMEVEANHGP